MDGGKGWVTSMSSLAAEKEGDRSDGRSFTVTLAGRAGLRASMGATMQCVSRHSCLALKNPIAHTHTFGFFSNAFKSVKSNSDFL